MDSYDPENFSRAQAHAQDLKADYGARDTLIDNMLKMYTLVDPDAEAVEKKFKSLVNTRSPTAANAIETGVRLMTANYPGYSASEEMNRNADVDALDTIEEMAATMMRQSDRVRGQPVHVDGARSGLLTDEIIISVNSTADMLEYARRGKQDSPSARRMERIAAATPYLFDVVHPKGCYYELDWSGVRSFVRVVEMTKQQIADQFGSVTEGALGSAKKGGKLDRWDVWMSWDLDWYYCWVDGASEPIAWRKWELSFVPWVVHLVEGSRMWEKLVDQRRPFLYTLYKSGMWSRENIALSAIFTRVQTFLWSVLVYEAESAEAEDPKIDTDNPLSILRVNGGKLGTLPPDPKENSLWQAYQLAASLGEQSTIYRQVAGEGSGSRTYSETALLNQAGRLPLAAVQRKLAWALGDALKLAFLWMKEGSDPSYSAKERGQVYELAKELIPADLEIECSIDPTRPEDMLQQGQLVKTLQDTVDDEYLYEHLLHVRQPGKMVERLWKQRYRNLRTQQLLQAMAQPAQPPQPQPEPGMIPGLPAVMAEGGMGGPEPATFEQGMGQVTEGL